MNNKTVLVSVLKNKRDLSILLKKRWYRIPAVFLPKRCFNYVAFYQPAIFGQQGKQIQYYAACANKRMVKRIKLLPDETGHPRAQDSYLKINFIKIKKLPRPIKNIIPRRIYFGFTTLRQLFSSKNILELYGVPPIEQIVEKRLRAIGIKPIEEFNISKNGRRYRIDLAVFCKNGPLATECDNLKSHRSKTQIRKDKTKDAFLRRHGWSVIRLKEKDILENLDRAIFRIQERYRRLQVDYI